MNLTEISVDIGTTKQNISQIASRGIKKLYKRIRTAYNLTYLDAYEMLLVGLNAYSYNSDVEYIWNNLSKSDKDNLKKERKNFIRNK